MREHSSSSSSYHELWPPPYLQVIIHKLDFEPYLGLSTILNLTIIYRGHRRQSFVAQDVNELVELRARQRTFHGAYNRTAIGALGYALTILRLFDRDFYRSTSALPISCIHIDD